MRGGEEYTWSAVGASDADGPAAFSPLLLHLGDTAQRDQKGKERLSPGMATVLMACTYSGGMRISPGVCGPHFENH